MNMHQCFVLLFLFCFSCRKYCIRVVAFALDSTLLGHHRDVASSTIMGLKGS